MAANPSRPTEPAATVATVVDHVLEATVAGSWSRIGYEVRRRLPGWDDISSVRLDGRVVVLTGFTSGIGEAAAHRLGQMGAHLHLVGRDPTKCAVVTAELRAEGAEVTTSIADLSVLHEVARVADEIVEAHDRLDVLIHNAGALLADRRLSPEGVEVTVATQVLAPYLLTKRLVPLLEATPGSRVLTMSSGGMYAERLDVDALEMGPDEYSGTRAYARAKRAQVALTELWARAHPRIAFHALHPGWVDTPGVESGLPRFHQIVGPLLRDPDAGADTLVWLAAADEPSRSTGRFWLDRRHRWVDKVPWTRAPEGEDARLRDWCEDRIASTGVPLGPPS